MFGIHEIKAVIENPEWIGTELNRLYYTRGRLLSYNPRGVDIFKKDWDALVILDACRYDIFKEMNQLSGELSKVISRGAGTREFVRGNFTDKSLDDVVYVDSNGHYAKLYSELNSNLHHYEYVENRAVDGLTAYPEDVTDVALSTLENFPNKRLIVHYMQPHQPYLGETGKDIEHTGSTTTTVTRNSLDRETVLKAYRENLEIVFESVDRLLNDVEGKTVITSDHGDLLGERQKPLPMGGFYGHPAGLHLPELVEVPWLVHESGNRKNIKSGSAGSQLAVNEYEIEEKLSNLGYRM